MPTAVVPAAPMRPLVEADSLKRGAPVGAPHPAPAVNVPESGAKAHRPSEGLPGRVACPAAPARRLVAGSEPLRELQTDQSGLRDAVVHGNWAARELGALGIPELAAPTVERVLDEQLERVGIASHAEGEVGDSISLLLPEHRALGGEQVGPDCGLVCEVALHVCLHPREWERI